MKLADFLTGPLYYVENTALYQQTPASNNTLSSLALTDALLSHAGETEEAGVHFWHSNKPTVILGMMDTELAHLQPALHLLDQHHYEQVVRHSGGLAVPSDDQTLNFSFLLKSPKENRISIDDGYRLVHSLFREVFGTEDAPLSAAEVPNSYCPGDYDLSVGGKKIAGLAQRRAKEGLAVTGYVSVGGNQYDRTQMMKEFYSIGKGAGKDQNRYPEIDPSVMTTVSDSIGKSISKQDVQNSILTALEQHGADLKPHAFSPAIQAHYQQSFDKLLKRNRRMLGNLFQEEVFV